MVSPFKSVFGSNSVNDNIVTNEAYQEVVFLLGGDDIVHCDFKTSDYIIGGEGQDTLYTGGAFEDFTISAHPLAALQGMFIVRSNTTGINVLVKDVETFNFTEGNASLDDFVNGIAPGPKVFDQIIGLEDFQANLYQAADGVSEQFLIDLDAWQAALTIDGFNADEDQIVIVTDDYSNAQSFVAANPTGEAGTWGWTQSGDAMIFNPSFNQLVLSNITGAVGNETIFAAESDGWLKFDDVDLPALNIDINDFVNFTYNATGRAEIITISLSAWNQTLNINNFDADQDKLVIDSNGLYTSADNFIAANPTGEAGTWGFSQDGNAVLFDPSFQQISLTGIANAEDQPTLPQAELQGWIQFI